MRIDVPWGSGTVPVEIDPERVGGVLSANTEPAVDPERTLRRALAASRPTFREFLEQAPSPLLVVVNDATRPTPTAAVMRLIGVDLDRWLSAGEAGAGADDPGAAPGGAPGPLGAPRDLAFVVATGTHRAATPDELVSIFGRDVVAEHLDRISSHDCRDSANLVRVGRTSRGNELWANRLLADARSVICINSVEPHYFAGYTGGRKSLFPGLAGYDTVKFNHMYSLHDGSDTLVLEGNPVHEDLDEATRFVIGDKRLYSIQLVLDQDHGVGFAAAGNLGDSFRRAVALADEQFVLDLDQTYDIVVSVAPHPMDCDLYQTNKAIRSGALALKPGGVLIVVSECPNGLGDNTTLVDLLAAADSPDQVLEDATRMEYRLGLQQATGIARVLRQGEIWIVTSLAAEQMRSIFFLPFTSVQAAIDAALRKKGPGAKVLFLLEASITVPRVRAT
jgi:nickel-dependent lactate racemase